jgi:predicted NBD/HSP70 family sugar kinase
VRGRLLDTTGLDIGGTNVGVSITDQGGLFFSGTSLYLTPDEADELASVLRAKATAARAVRGTEA